jgi:hypothetical protein
VDDAVSVTSVAALGRRKQGIALKAIRDFLSLGEAGTQVTPGM